MIRVDDRIDTTEEVTERAEVASTEEFAWAHCVISA